MARSAALPDARPTASGVRPGPPSPGPGGLASSSDRATRLPARTARRMRVARAGRRPPHGSPAGPVAGHPHRVTASRASLGPRSAAPGPRSDAGDPRPARHRSSVSEPVGMGWSDRLRRAERRAPHTRADRGDHGAVTAVGAGQGQRSDDRTASVAPGRSELSRRPVAAVASTLPSRPGPDQLGGAIGQAHPSAPSVGVDEQGRQTTLTSDQRRTDGQPASVRLRGCPERARPRFT